MRTIVTDAVRCYLERNIRADTRAFSIEAAIEDGSRSLQQVFADQHEIARANDTSFGVGFAPLSTLEQKVLHSAAILRSAEFRAAFPAAGDDFKIMGLRTGAVLAFTVAIAMIDRHVESIAHYFNIKHQVHAYLADRLGEGCTLHLNALDDPDARDESGVYLTVSGLSAEMGDDGQVGRGNRVNGLITPGRAMSLEAAAGKNPAAHVGKIYSVLAHRLAAAICTQIPGVTDVTVQLLSRIGQPIDRPQMAVVELRASGGITAGLQANVEAVVTDRFRHIADLTGQLASGVFPVY